MLKLIKFAVLGLVTASTTLFSIPEVDASVLNVRNETQTISNESVPLIAQIYRDYPRYRDRRSRNYPRYRRVYRRSSVYSRPRAYRGSSVYSRPRVYRGSGVYSRNRIYRGDRINRYRY